MKVSSVGNWLKGRQLPGQAGCVYGRPTTYEIVAWVPKQDKTVGIRRHPQPVVALARPGRPHPLLPSGSSTMAEHRLRRHASHLG